MTALAGFVLCLCGCVTSIVPPRTPADPTTVCIVDYGRHASLLLPDDGGSVEFEYGEWKWFALGQTQSIRLIPVLFWPTQGSLARRHLEYPPDSAQLGRDRMVEEILSLQVSSDAAARLRQNLTARYEANLDTEIVNRVYGMSFVKDPADYTLLHNCNHELAAWLRDLGCTIRGRVLLARFKLVSDALERSREVGIRTPASTER